MSDFENAIEKAREMFRRRAIPQDSLDDIAAAHTAEVDAERKVLEGELVIWERTCRLCEMTGIARNACKSCPAVIAVRRAVEAGDE